MSGFSFLSLVMTGVKIPCLSGNHIAGQDREACLFRQGLGTLEDAQRMNGVLHHEGDGFGFPFFLDHFPVAVGVTRTQVDHAHHPFETTGVNFG